MIVKIDIVVMILNKLYNINNQNLNCILYIDDKYFNIISSSNNNK